MLYFFKFFGFDCKYFMTVTYLYQSQDNKTPIILHQALDVVADSANMQTNTKQRKSITNSAKRNLYSAATYVFSVPKSCKITYPGTEDAHGINI